MFTECFGPKSKHSTNSIKFHTQCSLHTKLISFQLSFCINLQSLLLVTTKDCDCSRCEVSTFLIGLCAQVKLIHQKSQFSLRRTM